MYKVQTCRMDNAVSRSTSVSLGDHIPSLSPSVKCRVPDQPMAMRYTQDGRGNAILIGNAPHSLFSSQTLTISE